MSEKELADLDKEFDSITAPTCPYKIQPHNQGGEMTTILMTTHLFPVFPIHTIQTFLSLH